MIVANGEEIPFQTQISLSWKSLLTFHIERCEVEKLDLSNNRLSELRIPEGGLPKLERLYLSNNRLSELRIPEEGLPKLEILVLSGNQLSEFQIPEGGLPNLKELYLSRNQLSEFRIPEGGLPNLKVLGLSYNKFSEFRIPEEGLPRLEILELSRNPLTVVNGYFPSIKRIYLFGTKVKFVDQNLIDKVKDVQIEVRLHFPTILPEIWKLPQPIAEEIVEQITL